MDGRGDIVGGGWPTTSGEVPRFFSNLLPEGRLRTYLANRAGVRETREFELLELVGRDLSGAVDVTREGSDVDPRSDRRWPPAEDGPPEIPRFPLAGVQLKFSAVEEAGGGLTIPARGIGGDWIVKLPSLHYEGVPENEYSIMSLAGMVGIDTPETRLVPKGQIGGLPPEVLNLREVNALAVRGFDRTQEGRVHMEDFAQALGQRPADKYDERRTHTDLARLVAMVCGESSAIEFAKRLMFSAIVGNGDMHLRNWSLLYPDRRTPELSPAYDLLCTTVYIQNDNLALRLGTELETVFAIKNITVSVDEEVHRLARIRAAERDTSVSALVRDYLRRLATGRIDGTTDGSPRVDVDELRRRRLREALADIRAASDEFKAADNVPRDQLYDRTQDPADRNFGSRDVAGG